MKAIVIRQPWATLVATKAKTIETRPGPPNGPMRPDGVRGLPGCTLERGERIAIVAGASRAALQHGDHFGSLRVATNGSGGAWLHTPLRGDHRPLPLGAVVCTVAVEDALPVDDRIRPRPHLSRAHVGHLRLYRDAEPDGSDATDQLPLGDFTPGRWGWLFSDVKPCEPIPCKGRQGVFTLPDDVAARLAAS